VTARGSRARWMMRLVSFLDKHLAFRLRCIPGRNRQHYSAPGGIDRDIVALEQLDALPVTLALRELLTWSALPSRSGFFLPALAAAHHGWTVSDDIARRYRILQG